MKYEITIRQLTEYTKEEKEDSERRNRNLGAYPIGYSDQPYHEVRVLHAEVSKEEFEAVKRAIVGIM